MSGRQVEGVRESAILLALIYVAFFVMLTSTARDLLLRDPDLFWHITVGRRILSTLSVPWIDDLSHTFAGRPWIAKEWLSQVILAGVYDLAGWKGLAVLAGCAVALTFTLLFMTLSDRMRLVPALIATLFAYALSTTHFIVRPHLLTFPLLVLWVGILVRAVEARKPPSFLSLAIIILWANLHSGFTLGLLLAAGFALEAVVTSDKAQRWETGFRWGIFVVATGAASLVTPYGHQAILMTPTLLVGNESLKYISEWQPINFVRDRIPGQLILLALFASLFYGVRLPFVRCVITLGMIYLMLTHFRFIALAAIVIPVLISGPLVQQFAYLRRSGQGEVDPALAHALRLSRKPGWLILLLTIAVAGAYASVRFPEREPLRVITPVRAVDYIKENRGDKNVYNDYLFGGYLIFRGIPTFVDGRSDQLFGGGFLDSLYSSLEAPKAEFLKLLDKYRISLALVKPNSPETIRLDEASGWRRVYADDIAVVYERVP